VRAGHRHERRRIARRKRLDAGFVDHVITLVIRVDPGALVVQSKQFDRTRDIGHAADRKRHPPALGQHVVWERTPFTNKLLADSYRERHVKQTIAVNVSEFAPADPEFAPAKTVRHHFDTGPAEHRQFDLLCSSRHCRFPASEVCSPLRLGPLSEYDALLWPLDLGHTTRASTSSARGARDLLERAVLDPHTHGHQRHEQERAERTRDRRPGQECDTHQFADDADVVGMVEVSIGST